MKLFLPITAIIALIALWINVNGCNRNKKATFSVSFDHIKEIRDLHLMKYYFDAVIPIDKKDKLKVLLIVPASVESYINMYDVDIIQDSLGSIEIGLPEIKMGEVFLNLDSAKIYDFKHFSVSLTDNEYGEAVRDIQDGFKKAKENIINRCKEDGVEEKSRVAASEWFYNWGKMTGANIKIKVLKQ